jgi:hypothetical protein
LRPFREDGKPFLDAGYLFLTCVDVCVQLEALSVAKVEAEDKVASLQADIAANQTQWNDEKYVPSVII